MNNSQSQLTNSAHQQECPRYQLEPAHGCHQGFIPAKDPQTIELIDTTSEHGVSTSRQPFLNVPVFGYLFTGS